MKALLFLSVILCLFASCSQEIMTNDQAFQAVKDSTLFRGTNNSAVINDNGSIVVRGLNNTGSVSILVTTLNQSDVELGENAIPGNVATYTDVNGTIFSTNNGNSNGEVTLQINGNNSVSGEFNFTAFNASVSNDVTFSQGFIFEVPILNQLDDGDVTVAVPDNFTARINTIIYNPTVINAVVSSNVIIVSGNTGDRSMAITVPEDITPGTYDITQGGPYLASYTTPAGVSIATMGSLTIVSNDTADRRIVGDFIFDTADGFIITDGQFEVGY